MGIFEDMREAADMLEQRSNEPDPFASVSSAMTLAIAIGVTPEDFETKLDGEPAVIAEVMRVYRRRYNEAPPHSAS
jgi:hypothetical protein